MRVREGSGADLGGASSVAGVDLFGLGSVGTCPGEGLEDLVSVLTCSSSRVIVASSCVRAAILRSRSAFRSARLIVIVIVRGPTLRKGEKIGS